MSPTEIYTDDLKGKALLYATAVSNYYRVTLDYVTKTKFTIPFHRMFPYNYLVKYMLMEYSGYNNSEISRVIKSEFQWYGFDRSSIIIMRNNINNARKQYPTEYDWFINLVTNLYRTIDSSVPDAFRIYRVNDISIINSQTAIVWDNTIRT